MPICKNLHLYSSYSKGTTPQIKSSIVCHTKFVIHLNSCNLCQVQYIGCTTTPLKVWIRRHLSDIQKVHAVNISAVSKLFQEVHVGNTTSFSFMGIEKVYNETIMFHSGLIVDIIHVVSTDSETFTFAVITLYILL